MCGVWEVLAESYGGGSKREECYVLWRMREEGFSLGQNGTVLRNRRQGGGTCDAGFDVNLCRSAVHRSYVFRASEVLVEKFTAVLCCV